MSAIFLSTESQSPAAQMIIDCFIEIQQNMDISDYLFHLSLLSKHQKKKNCQSVRES